MLRHTLVDQLLPLSRCTMHVMVPPRISVMFPGHATRSDRPTDQRRKVRSGSDVSARARRLRPGDPSSREQESARSRACPRTRGASSARQPPGRRRGTAPARLSALLLETAPACASRGIGASSGAPSSLLLRTTSKRAADGSETTVTVIVLVAWAVTSGLSGWFSGWRRADSRRLCRLLGLTGKACVARRHPRTAGVT